MSTDTLQPSLRLSYNDGADRTHHINVPIEAPVMRHFPHNDIPNISEMHVIRKSLDLALSADIWIESSIGNIKTALNTLVCKVMHDQLGDVNHD